VPPATPELGRFFHHPHHETTQPTPTGWVLWGVGSTASPPFFYRPSNATNPQGIGGQDAPQKPPKIFSLPRKTGWWILWPSKHPAAHQKANKTHSRPFLAGGYIEKATGVPKSTVLVWCEEQEHFSTVQGCTVENPPSVLSADGKERPSERLKTQRPGHPTPPRTSPILPTDRRSYGGAG
jgi:hypothetical protein